MLTESGPQSLKLSEVARAAGVVTGSVIHHFGSIDGVQTALMERMVADLLARVLAITESATAFGALGVEAMRALFATFEQPGAARLAAWLVMTGQASRLMFVRTAVQQILQATLRHRPLPVPEEAIEDFILIDITIALGSGLFGPSLSGLLGKPSTHARDVILAMLTERIEQAT